MARDVSATPRAFDVGMFTIAVAVGDFNGDNRPDLVAGFTTSPFGAVLLNDGAGGFGTPVNLPVGNSPFPTSRVEAVDLDGDGKLDLLFGKGPEIQIYKGDGAGGFTPQPLLPLPFTQVNGIGDFDGDGSPDLYFFGGGGSSQGELTHLSERRIGPLRNTSQTRFLDPGSVRRADRCRR